jgi:hypothetical protein
MKYRGVVYDVGLNFNGQGFSVHPFDPTLVEYDMRVIANNMHCQCRADRGGGGLSTGNGCTGCSFDGTYGIL